jgi:hypothetical protein
MNHAGTSTRILLQNSCFMHANLEPNDYHWLRYNSVLGFARTDAWNFPEEQFYGDMIKLVDAKSSA